MQSINASETVRRLNPHVFGAAPKAKAAPAAKPDSKPELVSFHKREKDLQAACEALLIDRGYYRLTAANAAKAYHAGAADTALWFGHMVRAKGNPFMADLFLFRRGRAPLCIELKVRPVWQPGQLEMIWMGVWHCAANLGDFQRMVVEWEGGGHG